MAAEVVQWIADENGFGAIVVSSGTAYQQVTQAAAIDVIRVERSVHLNLGYGDPIRSLIENSVTQVHLVDYDTRRTVATVPITWLLNNA